MKHNYEQRRQNRLIHAKKMADKKREESNRLSVKAQEMAAIIPMGQPILVGHSSEHWDRRYRQRIHKTMDKSVAVYDAAGHYEQKAAGSDIFQTTPNTVLNNFFLLHRLFTPTILIHS